MWAKPNEAFYWDECVKWRPLKEGATVRRQPRLTLYGMFVEPFSFVSYYFLELNLMILVFISRRHITASWGRDMGTIFRPTQISIWICGWRQDRLVDSIKIEYTDSPTLRLRTCGRLVVSQPLGAPNQYQAPSLKSSWPCNNTRLISPKNISNSWWIMNNSVKWSWTWDHR